MGREVEGEVVDRNVANESVQFTKYLSNQFCALVGPSPITTLVYIKFIYITANDWWNMPDNLDNDNPNVVASYSSYQTNLYKYGPNIK